MKSMLSNGILAISIPATRTSNPRYASSFNICATADLSISCRVVTIACDRSVCLPKRLAGKLLLVIARSKATKQSMHLHMLQADGLLRCARNDVRISYSPYFVCRLRRLAWPGFSTFIDAPAAAQMDRRMVLHVRRRMPALRRAAHDAV